MLGTNLVEKISLYKRMIYVRTNRLISAFLSEDKAFDVPVRDFNLLGAHVFFSYYDVPQFCENEKLLLAMVLPVKSPSYKFDNRIQIGFFNLEEESCRFHMVGTSRTWCWQQGCRLQWYPSRGDATILYNKLIDGRYGCVVQNLHTREFIHTYARPIYAVSRDGTYGLTIDFSRLQRLRPGYGYGILPDYSKDYDAPDDNGIWRIDMITGRETFLFSIKDIAEYEMPQTVVDAQHYFNHLCLNIDGDRFVFFHIWQGANGKRYTRLLTSDLNGNNVRLLNGGGHVSHYSWKDNRKLLCYSTVEGEGEGYFLYEDGPSKIQKLGNGVLTEDGHPSFISGNNALITDTYPDNCGDQKLLLYDIRKDLATTVTKTYLPPKFYGETRCDLHPRISSSGKYVCIDYIKNDLRAMGVFDISRFASDQRAVNSRISSE